MDIFERKKKVRFKKKISNLC